MGNKVFKNKCYDIIQKELGYDYQELYCVWIVKVLQNNKGLFSTSRDDGLYYEITYNGDDDVFYVDRYKKESNNSIKL